MLKKIKLAAVLCAFAVPFAAVAAGPSGFDNQARPGAPQGFTASSVKPRHSCRGYKERRF